MEEVATPLLQLHHVAAACVIETTILTRPCVTVSLCELAVAMAEPTGSQQVKLRPQTPRSPVVQRCGSQAHAKLQPLETAHVHGSHGSVLSVYLGASTLACSRPPSLKGHGAVCLLNRLPTLAATPDVKLIEDDDLRAHSAHDIHVVWQRLSSHDDEGTYAIGLTLLQVLLQRGVLLLALGYGAHPEGLECCVLLYL